MGGRNGLGPQVLSDGWRLRILAVVALTLVALAAGGGAVVGDLAVASEESVPPEERQEQTVANGHVVEIEDWYDLDEIREDIGELSGDVVLLNDLNESTDGYEAVASASANDGNGFAPIGDRSTEWEHVFDGQGHTIADFVIDRDDEWDVGLFGAVSGAPVEEQVQSVRIENATVTGDRAVGALVGYHSGAVNDTTAVNVDVTGRENTGGLVGEMTGGNGVVANAAVTGTVTATGNNVGGLAGQMGATVESSHADVTVNADEGFSSRVGGLVGWNWGTITDSSAAGTVNGTDEVGGLAGYSTGLVELSSATAAVDGRQDVGGLVGLNEQDGSSTGTIEQSEAGGSVDGEESVGGLAGLNHGEIRQSAATGDVSGETRVGGLVGKNIDSGLGGTVHASTAAGAVEGTTRVGGLIGFNAGEVERAAATGAVTGDENVGGLVGLNGGIDDTSSEDELVPGTVDQSYAAGSVSGDTSVGGLAGAQDGNQSATINAVWDSEASATTTGIDALRAGIVGNVESLTTAEMQGSAAVDTMVGFDFEHVWTVDPGEYPRLQDDPVAPSAQTGDVTGTVTDEGTGESVANANVLVTDDAGAVLGAATTGTNGGYEITAPTGTVTVSATAPGYGQASVEDVLVEDSETTTVALELTAGDGPFFSVEIDETASELFVNQGEPLTVVVSVLNNGTVADSQEIALTNVADQVVDTTELDLDPGESQALTLEWDTEGVSLQHGLVNVTSVNETATAQAQVTADLDWRFDTDGVVDSSPTVVNHTVYVGSDDERLYALDFETGETVWRAETDGAVRSSPQVVDGTVYVGSDDGSLYAFDASDGTEQWAFETDDKILSSPTTDGNRVYVGSHDDSVYAVEADTGQQAWAFEADGDVNPSPTVVNETVYIADRSDALSEGTVYALDAESGDQQWAQTVGNWVWSSPTVVNGTVYVGSDDETLYAFDATDGSVEWTFDEPSDFVISSPTVVDGTVFVGTHGDRFYAVDATSGAQEWVFEGATDYFRSGGTVVEDVVYAGSVDNTVYGLDIQTGDPVWTHETLGSVRSSPTVVNGSLVVGSGDEGVYSLDIDSTATSRGSRVNLGTLGHTEQWATLAGAEGSGFEVELDAFSSPVVEGETVSATVTVTNSAPTAAEQTVAFETGTERRDDETVELAPGESQTITLEWVTDTGDAGEFDAKLATDDDAVTAPLVVLEPGAGYYDVSVDETEVAAAGNALNVTATVENSGDGETVQNISLFVDDQETAIGPTERGPAAGTGVGLPDSSAQTVVDVYQSLALAPGEQETVTLTWETTQPDIGDQQLGVASNDTSVTAQTTVVPSVEPTFEVSIREMEPAVRPGETVTAVAAIENAGAQGDTQPVELVDGNDTVLNSTSVSLAGAGNETVELRWETTEDDGGLVDLTVGTDDDTTTETVAVLADAVDYEDVSVSDQSVTLGSYVTVSATVENREDATTQYEAPAVVGNGVVDVVEDEVSPSDSETVSFTVPMTDDGEVDVGVGDADPVTVTVENAWSQSGLGDGNTGHSEALNGPTTAVEASWSTELEGTPTDPVLLGDRAYVGDDEGTVTAIDLTSGETVWSEDVGSAVTAGLAVSEERIHVGTESGVVALGHDGTQQWETSSEAVTGLTRSMGTVYAAGEAVSALDSATGDEQWEFGSGDVAGAPAVVGDTVYVGIDETLYALDAGAETDTERELWHVETGEIAGAPAYQDGSVYVGTAGDEPALHAVSADGENRWTAATESPVVGSPAVAGSVYVSQESGAVRAYDVEDGSLDWDFPTTGTGIDGSPAVADGVVSVSVADTVKQPRVVGIDTATGQQVWSHEADSSLSTGPAAFGGAAFVGQADGRLLALTEQTEGPILKVEHVSVNSSDVTAGEDVQINVTVTNVGSTDGEFEIDTDCQLEGTLFDCGVWLQKMEPDESFSLSTTTTLTQPGEWFILIESNPGSHPVTVTPPGSINGSVTDSQTGAALENTNVTAAWQIGEEGIQTIREDVTDEDGLYRLAELHPRTYLVEFERDRYVTERKFNVEVDEGKETQLDVELDEKVWVTGELERPDGSVADNHTVSLDEMIPEEPLVVGRNNTAPDGSFEVGVPAGESYALVVTEQDYPFRTQRYFPENGVADLQAVQRIDLTDVDPGETIDVGTVQFTEGYNVNVTVVDALGEPVVGADVIWRDLDANDEVFGEFHWFGTGFDGKPGGSFDDYGVELPAGPAEVVVETPWGDRVNRSLDIGADRNVTVEPDPELADRAKFEIQELDVETPQFVGETVTANATIQNVGLVSSRQDVHIGVVDRTAGKTESLTLKTGENATISFEWDPTEEALGANAIEVSTANDSAVQPFQVITEDEPYFDVQFGGAGLPVEGEPMDVRVSVQNLGGVGDVQDVTLAVDGRHVDTVQKLGLGAGDQTTVLMRWDTEDGDAGFHNVTVASEDRERTDSAEVLGSPEPQFDVTIDNASEQVAVGDVVTVEASIVNVGTDKGTQTITFTDDNGTVLDETNVTLDATASGAVQTVTFSWEPTVSDSGTNNLTVASEDDNDTTTVEVVSDTPVIDVNGDGNPATDTTGDGLLNDVTGDGEFDIFDVHVLFNNLDEAVVQNNASYFDFDSSGGGVDIFDVQALYNQLQNTGEPNS